MPAFRNIKRSYLFKRTCEKFTKNRHKLELNDIYIMYTVFELGGLGRFVGVPEIAKVCKRNRRAQNPSDLYNDCIKLTNLGFLMKPPQQLQYKLTVDGLNLLTDLEKKARKERWDR